MVSKLPGQRSVCICKAISYRGASGRGANNASQVPRYILQSVSFSLQKGFQQRGLTKTGFATYKRHSVLPLLQYLPNFACNDAKSTPLFRSAPCLLFIKEWVSVKIGRTPYIFQQNRGLFCIEILFIQFLFIYYDKN